MLKFTHVLNSSTGIRYYISQVILTNGSNEYQRESNCFSVDLEPCDNTNSPINDITIIIGEDGSININDKLTKILSNTFNQTLNCIVYKEQLVLAKVDGQTLIVP